MSDVKRSRRGVYYDLKASPYEYQTPYGDVFKFSSAKRLEMYTRDVTAEVNRLERILKRNDLELFLPAEIARLLRRTVYRSTYRKIEG